MAHWDAFFNIKVFYPNASSYNALFMSSTYCKHGQSKKREHSERVCEVEYGVFTPWFCLLWVVWLMKQLFSESDWQSW